MNSISESFLGAGTDLADWAGAVTEHLAIVKAPGVPAQDDEIALTPWRISPALGLAPDRPVRQTALAEYCLTIGPNAPDHGCGWYDALWFAAQTEAGVTLIQDAPPVEFWRQAPGLAMTLSRRIERATEDAAGRVEHPLIFDIQTAAQANSQTQKGN